MSSPSARPSLPGAATSSVVGFLVVLELASGVLQAWLPPLLPSLLERYGVTAGDLNWVSAVFLISTLGMGLGSWAGGFIHDAFGTYAWLFISSAAIGLMAMVLALTFRAPRVVSVARPATAGAR